MMISESEYLKAKQIVEKYEKDQAEIKELLSQKTFILRITGCLPQDGIRQYIPKPKDKRIRIACQGHRFSRLGDLKKYYQITKTIKTGEKEWAINSRGNRVEWEILEAEVSIDFVKGLNQ